MSTTLRVLLSGAVVLVAVAIAGYKYWDYVVNPWTRDGQVRAQVVQITPRVSAPIIKLPIKDNQPVKAGDLLFEIDPRTFAAALDQANASLDSTRDSIAALEKQVDAAKAVVEAAKAEVQQAAITIRQDAASVLETKQEFERQQKLQKEGATSTRAVEQARANFVSWTEKQRADEAQLLEMQATVLQEQANLEKVQADLGMPGEQNAEVRAAKAAVEQAKLNLEFTKVKAPVDGYVTNLNLRLGSQAVANQPALALVDINSFWIHGFFKENYIEDMREGDRAIVTLMTYPDKPLEGRVDSLGWGIAQEDGSTGFDLLPTISPTFEWIRLAQRVPVRIHLEEVPDDVKLRVGTTASVLVMTGTAGSDSKEPVAAVPRALQ